MGHYAEAERELIAYFSDSSGGYWPSGGGYEPRTQSTVDPGASMANVLDSSERAGARRTHREVRATLALLDDVERTTLERAYVARQFGMGAMQTTMMTVVVEKDGNGEPPVVFLSPHLRPYANLAPFTHTARACYRGPDPATTELIVGWLDMEARSLKGAGVYDAIRREIDELMDAALASYELHRRARVRAKDPKKAERAA